MKRLERWERWGIYGGCVFLLYCLFMDQFPGWEGTIWHIAFSVVDYPAVALTMMLLPDIGKREIYGVPVPWQTVLAESIPLFFIGLVWWFILGALLSGAVSRLRRTKS